MKKFLIVLMVVAMASFLFVGCLGVTPEPDEPVDPDEPILPVSIAPVIEIITNVDYDPLVDSGIISLYSSATQYMNGAEVADGILVKGFAPKYSEVNIYVDGEIVGTSTAYGLLEYFIVFVAEDNLGIDGEKTIYATAKEVALAESDPSTEYEFTLDTVAPEIEKLVAIKDDPGFTTVTVTFDEAVNKDTAEDDTNWTVIIVGGILLSTLDIDIVSPEVVELEVTFNPSSDTAGDMIRVGYKGIEDLAGNKTDTFDYEYCWIMPEEE